MKTVRRLLYRDIAASVMFVALAFLSLFFFIDFVDELDEAGRRGRGAWHAVQAALLELEAGTLVSLAWQRGDRTLDGHLGLAERPFSPLEEALATDRRERVIFPLFGMKLAKTGSFLWRDSFVVERVLPGSAADETGLSEGDPLTIQAWKLDKEQRYALIQIHVKKRKSGFLESVVQLAAYLETDNFI